MTLWLIYVMNDQMFFNCVVVKVKQQHDRCSLSITYTMQREHHFNLIQLDRFIKNTIG